MREKARQWRMCLPTPNAHLTEWIFLFQIHRHDSSTVFSSLPRARTFRLHYVWRSFLLDPWTFVYYVNAAYPPVIISHSITLPWLPGADLPPFRVWTPLITGILLTSLRLVCMTGRILYNPLCLWIGLLTSRSLPSLVYLIFQMEVCEHGLL